MNGSAVFWLIVGFLLGQVFACLSVVVLMNGVS